MVDHIRGGSTASAAGIMPTLKQPIDLSENARTVLTKRYLRRGLDGKPAESIEEMFWRVAWYVAEPEAESGQRQVVAEHFFDLLTSKRFFPNSPTFTGAGTPLGQLAACFTADMSITTDAGIKRIADLEVGDRVLTHLGRYRPVTELHQRHYDGELLRIKVKLLGTVLEVTPEHPILTPDGWIEAGKLSIKDKIVIGVPHGERPAPEFDLAQSIYADELEVQTTVGEVRVRRPSTYQNSGRQAEWVQRYIQTTPDLARLCGYYVSEGTIGPDERYIRFTFNKDEIEYQCDVIQLIQNIFNAPINQSQSNHGNWMNINVYNRAVVGWFKEQFGSGTSKKRLPVWLQYANREIQFDFLVGLMRGDGMYTENVYPTSDHKKGQRFRHLRVTLSNPALIQQIWQLCIRLGYDPSNRPVDTTYVTPNANATAQITMPPLRTRDLVKRAFGIDLPEENSNYVRHYVHREGDQVYYEIENIERQEYSGVVYNCEVDEDHSYVTEGVVVHNCFVLPITDDMGRDEAGIFQTLRNAALIQQTGGGNGFAFSGLRPKGARVKTSAGEATGPIGFLRVYDQAFGEIAQGGSRRGANMGVLKVNHPDIREFITCKTSESHITNFNISVGVTDDFMVAAKENRTYDLINPQDGTVWETVRAREIFNMMVKQAHHNGEPGILFLDAANRDNPVPQLYQLESTNPCGEQYLGPFENCCLGSINLAQHLAPDGKVDWEKLRESTELSTRFLDDVVDANTYVPAVPQLELAAKRVRRIGLGIMGLADLMYHAGVRYGSKEGQEFASQVMEFVHYHAMRTSVELSKERGPFLAIRGSRYDPDDLKWEIPQPLVEHVTDWGRPALNWTEIRYGILEHGIRNGAQTTIAPTGTISTVASCEGYGCEPVFALAYMRHFNDNGKDTILQYTSPAFEQALIDAGLDEATRQRVVEYVNLTGSCQDVPEIPESIRHTFVVASDISAEEHVWMQAVMQRFCSNAISKTCNFPPTATEEDVAKAYQLAWELGCKGMTVYVAGSRDKVVLETAETAKAKGKDVPTASPSIPAVSGGANGHTIGKPEIVTMSTSNEPKKSDTSIKAEAEPLPLFKNEVKKPRARMLKGYTYRVETPLGTTFVTVNQNGGDLPFEVFIHTSKAGSETAAVSEALGRLISYILRMNSPIDSRQRLKEVIRQLEGIGGGRSLGLGPKRVRSLPDGVAQVLAEYIAQEESSVRGMVIDEIPSDDIAAEPPPGQMPLPILKGDLCPECGQAAVINEEGCRKCYACGFSEC